MVAKFFACRDSIKLGRKVARLLGTNLSKLHLANFADGEIRVWVEEKVKGKKCVVLQTTRIDPNNRLMELCLVVSALKAAVIVYIFSRAGRTVSAYNCHV